MVSSSDSTNLGDNGISTAIVAASCSIVLVKVADSKFSSDTKSTASVLQKIFSNETGELAFVEAIVEVSKMIALGRYWYLGDVDYYLIRVLLVDNTVTIVYSFEKMFGVIVVADGNNATKQEWIGVQTCADRLILCLACSPCLLRKLLCCYCCSNEEDAPDVSCLRSLCDCCREDSDAWARFDKATETFGAAHQRTLLDFIDGKLVGCVPASSYAYITFMAETKGKDTRQPEGNTADP